VRHLRGSYRGDACIPTFPGPQRTWWVCPHLVGCRIKRESRATTASFSGSTCLHVVLVSTLLGASSLSWFLVALPLQRSAYRLVQFSPVGQKSVDLQFGTSDPKVGTRRRVVCHDSGFGSLKMGKGSHIPVRRDLPLQEAREREEKELPTHVHTCLYTYLYR